jgi:hypothetical protein
MQPDRNANCLGHEIHIVCESSIWDEINRRLRSLAPNEACVFVATRPSRGCRRTTVLLKETIWPQPGDLQATPQSLEISSNYITRALDTAIDLGPEVGLALVHTHTTSAIGDGEANFSPRDDWYEGRLFPTILNSQRKGISASIVIGQQEGDVDGRVWLQDPDVQCMPASLLRILGQSIGFIELRSSRWRDHLDPDVMDRSTRIWGAVGRRILQNIRVGVVGLGGTGSIAFLSLVTMGIGNVYAWDKDVLGKENRHRVLGMKKSNVGTAKVDALKSLAVDLATADPFNLETFLDWATSDTGMKQMKDCDLVFCCVDKLAARVPLNEFAYAHLIPVVDMSSWIHSNNGIVDAIMTHAHVLAPGLPCCWCSGILTSRALMREAQGQQPGAERRAAYGLSLEDTDGVEPSVLPLNLAGVGLALLQFMQVALGICSRTPRDLRLILPEWELDESDLGIRQDCDCIHNTARGDTLTILPYTP